MNERIEKLAEQCRIETYGVNGELLEFGFDTEKFAELIVGECADIALEQKKWVEDMKVHNPNDEFWNRARIQQSQHIVDKIKEHLGVKE